eukprot:gnl/Dysnectes_brevis/2654_a3211_1305.p1 GENE.gnl/Dysnectes_brevis/2654_a3211_1305~~gnl/Dysnectes_brevis/2654_a3211_1305.p1  ORF type:complete len:358 (-),score=56.36 gnl/Dysnectes_brevis/2654_a3211_1305:176-1249(-)
MMILIAPCGYLPSRGQMSDLTKVLKYQQYRNKSALFVLSDIEPSVIISTSNMTESESDGSFSSFSSSFHGSSAHRDSASSGPVNLLLGVPAVIGSSDLPADLLYQSAADKLGVSVKHISIQKLVKMDHDQPPSLEAGDYICTIPQPGLSVQFFQLLADQVSTLKQALKISNSAYKQIQKQVETQHSQIDLLTERAKRAEQTVKQLQAQQQQQQRGNRNGSTPGGTSIARVSKLERKDPSTHRHKSKGRHGRRGTVGVRDGRAAAFKGGPPSLLTSPPKLTDLDRRGGVFIAPTSETALGGSASHPKKMTKDGKRLVTPAGSAVVGGAVATSPSTVALKRRQTTNLQLPRPIWDGSSF